MKKVLFAVCVAFALTACDSPSDCTPTTAAKYILQHGDPRDMNNPATVRFIANEMVAKVEYTKYVSSYYGTPICKMYYKGGDRMGSCYVYIPQTGEYEYFSCKDD